MKINDNLRDICWSLNEQHLHYRGLRRRREREKGPQGMFEKAIAEKVRCQEEVSQTNKTIELANRLVRELEVS